MTMRRTVSFGSDLPVVSSNVPRRSHASCRHPAIPDITEIAACGTNSIVRPTRTIRASALSAVYAARASQLRVQ